MIDSRSNHFARELFSGLPSHYDLLAQLLSFGQYERWREALVERLAASRPNTVLDVATGTAGVAVALAGQIPARLVGVDISEAMLHQGRANIQRSGLEDRAHLLLGAAEWLPFSDASFDAVSFTYLLRYVADPAATLRELARVLKPGGWLAGLDFCVPAAAPWHACWTLYTRWLLPLGGWLGGSAWHRVGGFLGPSIETHYKQYPLAWHAEAWKMAGITQVHVKTVSLGGGVLMWGQKTRG